MSTTTPTPSAYALDDETVANYRRDGFVRVPGVLDADEVARYRDAVAAVCEREEGNASGDAAYQRIFKQVIQLWQFDPVLRDLTLHPRVAEIATRLAGIPLRLWHDHMLVKKPHNGAPTEFHQDAPYWPLADCRHSLSVWVALVDVPVERGCMSFLPGQQDRREIRPIDLKDKTDLFTAAPDLVFAPRVTVPLRAGDVTFHNGYTPHTANANDTDEFRYAFVTIYMDRDATYSGKSHPVTDPMGLPVGSRFPDEAFPPLPH